GTVRSGGNCPGEGLGIDISQVLQRQSLVGQETVQRMQPEPRTHTYEPGPVGRGWAHPLKVNEPVPVPQHAVGGRCRAARMPGAGHPPPPAAFGLGADQTGHLVLTWKPECASRTGMSSPRPVLPVLVSLLRAHEAIMPAGRDPGVTCG